MKEALYILVWQILANIQVILYFQDKGRKNHTYWWDMGRGWKKNTERSSISHCWPHTEQCTGN
ncbi:MAG: hypothetical protein AN484_28330, partial [Aphanizomenon flos-aquae WA102]